MRDRQPRRTLSHRLPRAKALEFAHVAGEQVGGMPDPANDAMDDPRAEPAPEVIAAAQAGAPMAFNWLVNRYQSQVFSLCIRILRDRESAEDASQEAFLSAYRALPRFESRNFRAWLLRIAANECKDELRRRRRRAATTSIDSNVSASRAIQLRDETPGVDAIVEGRECALDLDRVLRQLPFRQRQAIVLVDGYGFTYSQVALKAHASVGTIKSRLHRGRGQLRGLLSTRV